MYSPETLRKNRDLFIEGNKSATEEELKRFIIHSEAVENFHFNDFSVMNKIPSLVLTSKNDRIFNEKKQVELAEKLNAKLILYENYSHAVYDEAPDFKQNVRDFLLKIAG